MPARDPWSARRTVGPGDKWTDTYGTVLREACLSTDNQLFVNDATIFAALDSIIVGSLAEGQKTVTVSSIDANTNIVTLTGNIGQAYDINAPVIHPLADVVGAGGGTPGTPAVTLSTSNSTGVASSVLATDATIAVFDATVPTTQAMGDSAATGSAAKAARRDHKHAMPSFGASAAAVGTSAAGAATTPSRSDHVHATGAGTPSTQAFGDAAATGSGPAAAMTDHKHAMPANPVRAQSSTTPAAVGTAAIGVGATDARADHVHATGAGTPSTQAFGDAAATGSGPAAAMTDHKHAMPANPKLGNIYVPAAAMSPALTSGATGPTQIEMTTNKQNVLVLDFPDGATSYAGFSLDMPTDYDAGTFTAEFEWSNANTTGNVVKWQVEARAFTDGDTLDQAWGTAVTVTDTYTTTAYQFMRSAATGAVTAAGTPAGGKRMFFRLARLGADAADTLTTDARLLGVRIVYGRS